MFGDRQYRVLLVSGSEKLLQSLMQIVPELNGVQLSTAFSVSAARREMTAQSFDMVIVNAPLPDETGNRFAIDAAQGPGCVVLLLVRSEDSEEAAARMTPHGVFTLPKPISAQTMRRGCQWLAAARERLRQTEKKTSTLEEKMEEIRLVNRAKWLLIEQLTMTEPEAHRYIEKQAMDRCTTRKEIARGIITTYA